MAFRVFKEGGECTLATVSMADATAERNRLWNDGFHTWIENDDGTVVVGKKPIRTIDITPTWRAILPVLLAAYKDGTETGQRLALEELQRMATAADAYNLNSKPAPLGADENIGSVDP